MRNKFLVYSADGRSQWYGREAIVEMLRKQKIRPREGGGRTFEFKPRGTPPEGGLTFTARGGVLALIGRGQCYTIPAAKGPAFGVAGHKRYHAMDRGFFVPWELRLGGVGLGSHRPPVVRSISLSNGAKLEFPTGMMVVHGMAYAGRSSL